ncbi:hypothetical protein LAZ67_11002115 [Cordylochernes scorpioides]|uniref:CUB domain-containing protein n=1 Tax=Cordylochernes scorpioides TaxID=51811 RepID=A0ABY6L3U0_9ARAC|nr:hypothetical protein LAZ67_11002115 [Cordylochernes scorpioides]
MTKTKDDTSKKTIPKATSRNQLYGCYKFPQALQGAPSKSAGRQSRPSLLTELSSKLLSCDAGCNTNLTQDSGMLTSPTYPRSAVDASLTHCDTVIQTSPNTKLSLYFKDFYVVASYQPGGTISCDSAGSFRVRLGLPQVYAGRNSSGRLLGQFCGAGLPNPVFTMGNVLFLRVTYKTNQVRYLTTFSSTYSAMPGCGGQFTGVEGAFSSPNYPHPYNSTEACTWNISVGPSHTLTLHLDSVMLSSRRGCDTNYLEVYDGAVRIARFCGDKETPGMCCSNGKVNLPPMVEPPQPLLTYVAGATRESKHFLQHIRKYNSCFQMTSFGATHIERFGNFEPTFKVQGQVYHQIGSLLPVPNEDPRFLQIYFMDNVEEEIDRRCAFSEATRRAIIAELQTLFHEHNCLVRDFKSAVENVRADDMKVIIRADKTPTNEHERRFNAPMTPEVAAVIVGTEIARRDIVICRRDGTKQRVAETHRSYDALQYPILFPRGEDGYHLELYQVHPISGAVTMKKVSCMNFYAYRIMIRAQESNHILKCRQLFQQFIVDMYAKVESERLNYIRFNQSKLRADQYIHLRDAIANEGAVAAANIGQMVILPASYAGSPRHMHEYAQDAMTYVRTYGRPDLFLTFTCNPAWAEIKNLLLPGQQSSHRHDLTARVFKQKLKCFIDLIVKNHIYGPTRCWMYSIEWQKIGTPHAHILIWLEEKILPTQIDNIISAELPDPQEDPELYQIIKKYMIHGPCGAQNPHSPCLKDGKCTKKYPRDLVHDTQTGGDGYPLYRRRKPEDGGHTATIKLNHVDFEVDNRWIVPYSPLLSKAFDAHINVEYCNSVKSIKYICKYVNKNSDMAVFGLQNPNAPVNEIDQFQMGRYISSNKAVWRIFGFDIHERSPAVVHLSVHLENGQRVYFTEESAAQRAENPPNTTLTAFFQLCASDTFAATLLYHEVPTYYT